MESTPRISGWLDAKFIGWLIVILVSSGVAYGVLSQDIKSNKANISKLEATDQWINSQNLKVQREQSSLRTDVTNIKQSLHDVQDGVDDIKELLIKRNRDED